MSNGLDKPVNNKKCLRYAPAFRQGVRNAEGFTIVDVPASTWAIFSTLRDESVESNYDLGTLKNQIYSEWLPTSKYSIIDGGVFEMYCKDKNGQDYCELWYRVDEK